MRFPVLILPLALLLQACVSDPPPAASGPGFTDYNSYLNQRAAEAAAAAASAQPAATFPGGPGTGFSTELAASAIDAATGVSTAPVPGAPLDPFATAPAPGTDTLATVPAVRPRGDAPTTIQTQSGEVAQFADGSVSTENDFQAVASQRTIADDAALIAANRAQYVVIQPGALPVRPGDAGPNIVEFALATNNPVGVSLFDRGAIALTSHERACAKFASPDMAQQEFLAKGGPERDPKNLDPDGDGFACSWDPAPFRLALQ